LIPTNIERIGQHRTEAEFAFAESPAATIKRSGTTPMKMSTSSRVLAVLAGIALLVSLGSPETARAQSAGPLLGSPSFKPTPERPVGWRGDWSGRFPGATPPIEWSRRVKGITAQIKYQADKPSGQSADDARPLEYFTIKDWLVAGPFAVEDAVKDIDKDFLGGEAKVLPAEGAKAGTTAWKALRVGIDTQSRHECNEGTIGDLNVDFLYTFGTITPRGDSKIDLQGDFANKVAYGHTYIYSPSDAKIGLSIPLVGAAGRFWLNGRLTDMDPKNARKVFNVELVKGWNRLLIKVSAADGTGKDYTGRWFSNWRFAVYLEPVGPVAYETKNIAWMTKMTGRSMSQPIVVGDKIFVGSGISDLMCIDKKTGKVLWLQSNTPYDAMTREGQAGVAEKIGPAIAQRDALNDETVQVINAAVSAAGMSSSQQEKVDKTLKAKADVERAIHMALRGIDRKKYPPMYENEVSASNAAPLSDGKYVYWVCGGGSKGPGAYVIACFDLAGKRMWSWHDGGSLGAMEHGNHASLALAEGRLIHAANKTLIAFDAKTGKELWRNSPDDWTNELCVTPVVATLGGSSVIIGNRYIHRVLDGAVICPDHVNTIFSSVLTPIVENGVLYAPGQFKGNGQPLSFIAVKLPAGAEAGPKAELLWAPDGKDVGVSLRGENFMIASPLYVDRLVYYVGMSGGLTALEPAAKECVYRRFLDGYNRYNRSIYGVCASPTLGGNYIYITDDAGYTHVLQPGTKYQEVAGNVLENIHLSGLGGNPCKQESFYTSPYFEGKCMYLRGEEYLYCIGGE
jgi:outer membrane protein assembly factor BamB